MSTNKTNGVPTRFTTEKVRLTYAFLWEPRSSSESDGDPDESKKYSTSLLIPKNDQATLTRLNTAIQYAIAVGQKKGLWGDKLPANFKLPLRDGDAESVEKGEEYMGHWFLNASSTRMPRLVDLGRNDILDPGELYSGCYARVCLNLFPFSAKGNRGIGCGLEAVQKICDGEPLGGVPVDLEEAFGDWNGDGVGQLNTNSYGQPSNVQAVGYPPQQAPGYPVQQQGYPAQQQAPMGYPVQQQVSQGYPIQQPVGYAPAGAPGYPAQQPQAFPAQQPPTQGFSGAPDSFASGVAAADSILPPQMFSDPANGRVA